MELTVSVDDVVQTLATAVRADVVDAQNGSWTLKPTWMSPILITEDSVASILDSLRRRSEAEGTTLFDAHHYEILIREESPGFIPFVTQRMGDQGIVKEDPEHKLIYKLSRASDEYLSRGQSNGVMPISHSRSSAA